MWGEVRAFLGGDYDKERLVAVDFERGSINALTATFPQPAVAGRYFHLAQPRYREVIDHGLSPKYMASEEFRIRAKQLSELAFLRLEWATMMYEHLSNAFAEADQGFIGYFEATYIDRRVAEGRRNPLFDQAIWNVESRMALGPMRANNAVESFRSAFSIGAGQDDRPVVYRFIQSLQLQQNISRGEPRAARCSATAERPRGRRD